MCRVKGMHVNEKWIKQLLICQLGKWFVNGGCRNRRPEQDYQSMKTALWPTQILYFAFASPFFFQLQAISDKQDIHLMLSKSHNEEKTWTRLPIYEDCIVTYSDLVFCFHFTFFQLQAISEKQDIHLMLSKSHNEEKTCTELPICEDCIEDSASLKTSLMHLRCMIEINAVISLI